MNFRSPAVLSGLGIALAVLLVIGVGLWFSYRAPDDSTRIARAVAKLVIVPPETPIVTTVVDPAKLADTPFAGEAKAGDRILFYTNAGRAILYDPQAERIIDMARTSSIPPTATPRP